MIVPCICVMLSSGWCCHQWMKITWGAKKCIWYASLDRYKTGIHKGQFPSEIGKQSRLNREFSDDFCLRLQGVSMLSLVFQQKIRWFTPENQSHTRFLLLVVVFSWPGFNKKIWAYQSNGIFLWMRVSTPLIFAVYQPQDCCWSLRLLLQPSCAQSS
jgi:hypothetical protein